MRCQCCGIQILCGDSCFWCLDVNLKRQAGGIEGQRRAKEPRAKRKKTFQGDLPIEQQRRTAYLKEREECQ